MSTDMILRDAADRLRLSGKVPTLQGVAGYLRGKAAAIARFEPYRARALDEVAADIETGMIKALPPIRTLEQIALEARLRLMGIDPVAYAAAQAERNADE